jgi:DNA-binding MarR family transcriptional regulator
MRPAEPRELEPTEEVIGRLVRRNSTAAVLFHHAIAERLGLGPTDHKCLDLLRERGAMTGSRLAAMTGLSSGAITGVVGRLERAGYVRREPDPSDRRKQILHVLPERMRDLEDIFGPIRADARTLLEGFDAHQRTAIAEFLTRSTEFTYRHAAMLRVQSRMDSIARLPRQDDVPGTTLDEGGHGGHGHE